MSERTILVLGGNAFAAPNQPLTMAGQFEFAQAAFRSLAPLLEDGRDLVITHGNGPQVGHMLIRVEQSLGEAYAIPLEVCVAESEGELGYVIEQSLRNVLAEIGQRRSIAGLLTEVVVDADDPAFQHPTKPVGPYYSAEQAAELRAKGFPTVEVAGRPPAELKRFRRVVPSPRPQEIVDVAILDTLLQSGAIVIAGGGGGIPVVREEGQFRGVEAVIDKDLTSSMLGIALDARVMIILTDVPCAYRCFGTDQQSPIGRIDIDTAQQLLDEGHFAAGSMRPKIEAGILFCRRPNCRTLIGNLDTIDCSGTGDTGTIIESAE